MKIILKKEVKEFKEVVVGFKCDSCGVVHDGSSYPKYWHDFSSHHSDWGNDSIDSYEYYLVCSPKCYFDVLKKVYKENSDRDSAVIDEMSIQFVQNLLNEL